MGYDLLTQQIREKYDVYEWKNAIAILKYDYPKEYEDLITVLSNFSLAKTHILAPGGGKSPIAKSINGEFYKRDWKETKFELKIHIKEIGSGHQFTENEVDEFSYDVPTHQIDYYKNSVAIETEWNNKDPFYDRDLNNFRLLHEFDIISVGVFITRATALQKLFDE